jgi:hypothetical protein
MGAGNSEEQRAINSKNSFGNFKFLIVALHPVPETAQRNRRRRKRKTNFFRLKFEKLEKSATFALPNGIKDNETVKGAS